MKKPYIKSEIIKILYTSAKKYEENLLNKNILFVFECKSTKEILSIETIFNDYNFMHLTGIAYTKGAKDFFYDCIEKRISPQDIGIKNEVFTKLKLQVLENMMSINKSAKKIGTYNNNKTTLKIEKVIGNIHCSLGFSNIIGNKKVLRYYYPKTLLQEEFKKNVEEEHRIIAIFSKNKKEKKYKELTYLTKKCEVNTLFNNEKLMNLIDAEISI